MGVLQMFSPNTQDINCWEQVNYSDLSSTYYRSGSYSFRISNGGYIQTFIPETTEGYIKYAFATTAALSLALYDISLANHLTILKTSTNITIKRGYTALDQYAYASPPAPGMRVIEAHWLIDDSSGIFQVKLDGHMIFDYSGDTKYAGTASSVTYIRFEGSSNNYGYIDDVVIRDDDWPGQGGVYVLVPNSGSALEDWTASAGNPEDCVDEIPPTFDDYISTDIDVADTEHLFNIEYLPIIPNAIKAVGVHVKMQSTEAASGDILTLLKSGGTMASGDPYPVLDTPMYAKAHYALNPDGDTVWSSGDINALEVGVKTI